MADNSEEGKMIMKKIFTDFASESTLHGIGHISNAKSLPLRLTWACFVFLAVAGLSYSMWGLLSAYLEYGYYETVTQDRNEGTLVFPDVTICDTVGMSEKTLANATMETILNIIRKGHFMEKYIANKSVNNQSNAYYSDYLHFMHTNQAFSAFSEVKDIPKFGVKASDLILGCKFGVHECTADDFESFLHPSYLNCYTFKGTVKKGKKVRIQNTGPQAGLSLILKAQDNAINPYFDFVSNTANTRTLRIAIHEPGTPSGISDIGIDILPGKSTSLGLKQKIYKRLKSPYAYCQEKSEYTIEDTTFKVNTQFCEEICAVDVILTKCRCVSINQNIHFSNLITEKVKTCLYMNENNPEISINKTHCEIAVLRSRFNSTSKNCDCNWSCNEIDYDISISQAKWPVRIATIDFLNHYAKSGQAGDTYKQLKAYYSNEMSAQIFTRSAFQQIILCDTKNESCNLLKKTAFDELKKTKIVPTLAVTLVKANNLEDALVRWVGNTFYRLNVYFKQGTVEKHTQFPTYSTVDLWSSIGGILGLWIGCSVLSIMELGYLVMDICWAMHKFCGNRNKKSKVAMVN